MLVIGILSRLVLLVHDLISVLGRDIYSAEHVKMILRSPTLLHIKAQAHSGSGLNHDEPKLIKGT